jgi:N-methylhydantoinase A
MASASLIGVDVGGTFTDHISINDDGSITALKVPTDTTDLPSSVIEGARQMGVAQARAFNHASTTGLNAVLTRNLPKIGFLATEGHRDILDMGRAWRPLEGQTNPHWRRSFGDAAQPIVPRYLRRGIHERILADGEVLFELDEAQAVEQLELLRRCGVEGVAICLINAYVEPRHEQRVRDLVEQHLPGVRCSISSDVSPLAKEYGRASTTVIDVMMKTVMQDYADRLREGLGALGLGVPVNFADCAATLAPDTLALQRPSALIFSGPAAGTVSGAYFGAAVGRENLICCDVGGTSTDISIVMGGKPVVQTTFDIEHDLIVNTLANEVITLGAGGGSIVAVGAAGELRVGPESAGGRPGPACYDRGGSAPTMTDACLLIGLIAEEGFAGGTMRLASELSQQAFDSLETPLSADQRIAHSYRIGLHNIAEGILDIAIRHAVDPRDYDIVAYGSAGPMLLGAVLEDVGARSVIVPPHPGLFSALGLLSTDQVFVRSRSAYVTLDADAVDQMNDVFGEMERDLLAALQRSRGEVTITRTFDGRLAGQTWDTPFVAVPDGTLGAADLDTMIERFHVAYEARWGKRFAAHAVEGVTYRVQVTLPTEKVSYPERETGEGPPPRAGEVELRHLGEPMTAVVYERAALRRGDRIDGPALVREEMASTHVGAGQVAEVGRYGELIITMRDEG